MRYLTLLLILGTTIPISAQNYNPFPFGDTLLYSVGGGYYTAMTYDSIRVVGVDTLGYQLVTIDTTSSPCDGTWGTPFGYYSSFSMRWSGGKVVKTPLNQISIKCSTGYNVHFEGNASLGDSWLFYASPTDSVLATIIAHDTMTIGDVVDSVKFIELFAVDGNGDTLSSTFNGYTLKLSASNGLVNSLAWKSFPANTTQKLTQNPGLQLLYRQDIYDYEPGDVFQFYHYSYGYTGFYYHWDLFTILDRVDYPLGDSVAYTLEKRYAMGAPDTITWKFKHLNRLVFKALPNESAFFNEATGNTPAPLTYQLNKGAVYGGRPYAKKSAIPFLIYGDSCLFDGSHVDAEYYSATVIAGIPPLVYQASGIGGGTDYTLNYYKKGAEEWGSYSSYIGVSIGSIQNKEEVQVYPNPATDYIQIENWQQFDAYGIYSLSGQLLLQAQPTETIDVSNLPIGLYLIELWADEQRFVQKLLIE